MITIKILALTLYLSIVQQYCYVFGSLVLHPNPVSNFNLRDEYEAVCLFFSTDDEGKIAYVSGGNAGTFIISLENPQIQKVLTIIPGVTVQHALRFSNYLFTADQFDGVSIYDVTDILNPILLTNLKQYAENTQFSIITKDGRYLFVLNSGLIQLFDILDIKSPTHLQTIGVLAPYSYRLKFNQDESFIAVSNHLNGVQMIDIRNMPHPVMRVNKNPSFVTWDCIFTNDMKISYAADAYFGLFIADITPISSYSPTNTTLFEPKWELIYPVNGALMMSLHITQDNSHLLIGFRSIGIYLFSVNKDNYKAITFVQHLQGSYMSIQIFMPKNNESLLLATNGNQFFVFEAVSPILNQEFPNLLNTFQSNLNTRTLTLVNPFVYCMKDAKHIISFSIDDNFTIYNIEDPYQLKKVSAVARGADQGFLSIAEVSSDMKYLYVASSNSGVLTYDISSLDTPIYLNQYYPLPKEIGNQALQQSYFFILTLFKIMFYSFRVSLNPSNTIGVIANSFYGIYYVDTTDPAKIKWKSAFNQPQACGFQECNLLKDEVRIICSCREIGVFFFQVEETGVISLKSIFKEIGSESQVVSSNEQILYACLGFQGVYIIDIKDFENPKQLSRLVVKGWAQQLWTLFNEKYLIVAQAEKGQLSLINIEDSKNPYIQQLLEFQDEDSITICVPEGEKIAFFSGNQGLRYAPIVTDLKIHTQIQIKKMDSDGNLLYYNTLKEGESLLVGQVAQFTFVPLFTEKKVKITGVKYYRYFEKQTLPSWMNYLPDKRQILMTVDKSGVMNDFSTEMKGENILILEVLIQVKADQFVLEGLISPSLSTHLITVLKDQGYLDYFGMLTDKLDPREQFNLDFFDTTYPKTSFTDSTIDDIRNRIKKVLVFSKYDYPIRFFIKSSLKFAFNKDSRMLSSDSQGGRNLESTSSAVVSTPSTQIKVFMQILKNGKFVKRTFEGVLASFSDDLTSVQISGQTSYVDSILQKNIQISNSTADLSQVQMSVLVSDSSNFDLQIDTSLVQLEFASFHKPVVQNSDKLLSDQLNLIYAGGDLPVEQRFQFSFDMTTFTQQDGLPMTYSAFIINSDGSETEILTGLWIEFSNTSLGFSGIKTIGAYRDSVTIKIIASDSYSKASSTFEIHFWTIPFFYLIQVGVSVIGPLLGVLGIWKYRHEIHLFLVERRNMYSDEIAIMGNTYKKQIILLSSIQAEGQKLWKHFERNSQGYIQEVYSYYKEHKSFDMHKIMEDLERFYLPIQNQFTDIDPREFDFNDSRLVRVVKQILFQHILSSDNNTKQAIHLLKEHAIKEFHQKDWYKMYIQINPQIQIAKNKVVRKKQFNSEDESAQQQATDFGVVVTSQEDKVVSMKFAPILEASEEIEIEGGDTNRVTLRQIPFLSPTVSQPLNYETQLFDKIDVNKKHKDDQQKYQFFDLNPFPEMVVNDQVILRTLKLKNFQKQYDFYLLSESIALEASGFTSQPPSSINPTVGESIHEHQDSLLTISAYKRNKVGLVGKVMEFLNMDYVSIGLVRNNPLPKWLNYQIIDGIINFWGVPTLSDESEILIRIINKTLLTVHSFRILVQDKERHDCRDRNLLRKVTKKFGVNQRGTRSKMHSTVRLMAKSNLINSEAIYLQSDNNILQSEELKNNVKPINTINHEMKQEVPFTGEILIEFEDETSSKNRHNGQMEHS